MINIIMIVISVVIVYELLYRFFCWIGWFVASEEEEWQDAEGE